MSSENKKSENSFGRRLKITYITIAALAGGILAFGERTKEFIESQAIDYVLIAIELFKFELFILLFTLVFWDKLYLLTKKSASIVFRYIFSNNSKNRRERYSWVAIGISIFAVILGIVSVATFHSWYYAKGKYIYLTNYHRVLIKDSEQAFEKGQIRQAKSNLKTCMSILFSPRCETRYIELNERLDEAQNMRRLLRELKPSNYLGRIKIVEDIYYLDKNEEFFEEASSSLRHELKSIQESYSHSITKLMAGSREEAKRELQDINKKYPGYGDSHIIIRELENGRTSASTPYVSSLQILGPYRFSSITTENVDSIVSKYME